MSAVHLSFEPSLSESSFTCWCALLLLVAASALPAQIVETGIITGIVKDNTGAVVMKAGVTVRNTGTG